MSCLGPVGSGVTSQDEVRALWIVKANQLFSPLVESLIFFLVIKNITHWKRNKKEIIFTTS